MTLIEAAQSLPVRHDPSYDLTPLERIQFAVIVGFIRRGEFKLARLVAAGMVEDPS